jgi:hypothetical protein
MKSPGATLLFILVAYGSGYEVAERRAAAQTHATMPEHVVYQRSGCAPLLFDETALAGRLRVELAEGGTRSLDIIDEQPDEARTHDALVKILGACEGGALVVVIEGRNGLRARRPVDLSAMAPALRERALAIALVELLSARGDDLAASMARSERPRDPEPAPGVAVRPEEVEPTLPAAPRPARRDAFSGAPLKPPDAPPLLSGGIEWRFLFTHDTTLTGGRIAASLPAGSDWLVRLSAEAGVFYDSEQNMAEVTELWLATGSLGMSTGYRWELAEIGLGPRLELGWGQVRVTSMDVPTRIPDHGDVVIVASVIATGRARLTRRFWLSLDVELGHVLRGLDAHSLGRSPAGFRGALGGARIGVALEL